MYRLVLELNENCYQHLILDTKVLGNDINLGKLCNELKNDLHAIGYKLERVVK